jgi:ferric-dicitrate binding protein FerR (iron transport regulator)
VAQIDQAPTVEDLPSTEQLRDLLDGKVRPPPGRHTLWLRVGLLVALLAALFWLCFVRKSLLELITDG